MNAVGHQRDVLVIGIGNPDRGDDGFGIRVIEALAKRPPAGATLTTRRGDMLALLDDWAGAAHVICVDAAAPIDAPGHLHRIDAMRDPLPVAPGLASSHGIGLAEALALARRLNMAPSTLIVFAVEGESFERPDTLSPAVAAQVDSVAGRVAAEVELRLAVEA